LNTKARQQHTRYFAICTICGDLFIPYE